MNPDAQEWLLNRLAQFGADVYVQSRFSSLSDRLAHVIVTNRLERVIAGHHEGQPITYRQAWERIYGASLKRGVTHES